MDGYLVGELSTAGFICTAFLPWRKAGVGLCKVAQGLSKYFCLERKCTGAASADDASLGLKMKDPMEILWNNYFIKTFRTTACMEFPQGPQLYQPQLFSGSYFLQGCINRICIYHMKSSRGQVESKTLQVTHPARASEDSCCCFFRPFYPSRFKWCCRHPPPLLQWWPDWLSQMWTVGLWLCRWDVFWLGGRWSRGSNHYSGNRHLPAEIV